MRHGSDQSVLIVRKSPGDDVARTQALCIVMYINRFKMVQKKYNCPEWGGFSANLVLKH